MAASAGNRGCVSRISALAHAGLSIRLRSAACPLRPRSRGIEDGHHCCAKRQSKTSFVCSVSAIAGRLLEHEPKLICHRPYLWRDCIAQQKFQPFHLLRGSGTRHIRGGGFRWPRRRWLCSLVGDRWVALFLGFDQPENSIARLINVTRSQDIDPLPPANGGRESVSHDLIDANRYDLGFQHRCEFHEL